MSKDIETIETVSPKEITQKGQNVQLPCIPPLGHRAVNDTIQTAQGFYQMQDTPHFPF